MTIEQDIAALKDGNDQILTAVKALDTTFLRDALSLASDVAGVIGIVGIPGAIANLIGMFTGAEEKTAAQLNAIEGLLKVTFSVEQSGIALSQMQRVTGFARDCMSALNTTLMETRPYDPSALSLLNIETGKDMDALADPSSWLRVFFDQLLYSDNWFGTVKLPPDTVSTGADHSFAFDYRLTLPCYLKGLSARCAALGILQDANFVLRDAVVKELLERAAELSHYRDTILRGWQRARIPTYLDIEYLDQSVGSPPPIFPNWMSTWDQWGGRSIGVVDAYRGDGIVGTYPADKFPNSSLGPFGLSIEPPNDTAYVVFTARYLLGLRRRECRLYLATSLDLAWIAIQDLRAAAGQPKQDIDPFMHVSVRDVISSLGSAYANLLVRPPGAPPPPDSLWDTTRRLALVGEVDNTGELLVSLRGVLDAATV